MRQLNSIIKMTQKLKDIYPDMTVRQFRIFLEIAYEEGQTQFHYSRKCMESEALVSRTCKNVLEAHGLIKTGVRPDGRSKSVLIAEGGKKLLEELYEDLKESQEPLP